MASAYKMEGKVAIVTGSSSGIGEAIALFLARSGTCVTLCGRNADRLESARNKCQEVSVCEGRDASTRFLTVQGDLNDPAIRTKTVRDTVSRFGKLDILVLNAGETNNRTIFMDETEAGWDRYYNIMLKSVVLLLQEAVPHLAKSAADGGGSVFIVSSPASGCVLDSQLPYGIIKAAVNALVTNAAAYLGPMGIRVNATQPGWVSTDIIRHFTEDKDQRAILNKTFEDIMASMSPFEARLGTLEEHAEVAGFLLSGGASYVTGANLLMDAQAIRLCPSVNTGF